MPTDNDSFLLGRMDAKLDALLTRSDKHDERITRLEQFRWMLLGGASVLGGLGGWLAKVLTS